MSSGQVLRHVQGPVSRERPVHYCDYPMVETRSTGVTYAPGSQWECECGRKWIVMRDYCLNGSWRASWKTSNPFRRLLAERYT